MEVGSIIGSALDISRGITRDLLGSGIGNSNNNNNNRKTKGALQEVERKMKLIERALEQLQHFTPSNALEGMSLVAITEQVTIMLEELRAEIERVRSMNTFLYLLKSKEHQDRLRTLLDSLQFYLVSIEFSSEEADTAMDALLRKDWDNILKADPELAQKLQQERAQAEDLQRKVVDDKEELELEQLQNMGLVTQEELDQALQHTQDEHRRLVEAATQDGKQRAEAAYLEQVIQMLESTTMAPTRQGNQDGVATAATIATASGPGHQSVPECPISLDRLRDPVILDCSCRGTVSRKSFAKWKLHQVRGGTGRAPCPSCGRPLVSFKVVPNVPLRQMLEAYGTSEDEEETVTLNENTSLSSTRVSSMTPFTRSRDETGAHHREQYNKKDPLQLAAPIDDVDNNAVAV